MIPVTRFVQAVACVILPVVWGVFAHWVFQRLRTWQQRHRRRTPDNWQDYQI